MSAVERRGVGVVVHVKKQYGYTALTLPWGRETIPDYRIREDVDSVTPGALGAPDS